MHQNTLPILLHLVKKWFHPGTRVRVVSAVSEERPIWVGGGYYINFFKTRRKLNVWFASKQHN